MHPSAQAWMCHLIGLFVASEESVPQRGTRMSSPVQARDERSAGDGEIIVYGLRSDPRGHTSILCASIYDNSAVDFPN